MSTTVSETASPWHAAYPNPRTAQPAVLTRDAVLAMIKTEPDTASKSFVLVDLRRADHNVQDVSGLLCKSGSCSNTSFLGRHNSRFDKFTGTKLIPCHTDIVQAVQVRRGQ